MNFRKVGKQIPGVAEFDFPNRQTPRHPIQIPISVPSTRHTRITEIWLGHARPLFQLGNPLLSHWWCLHSWELFLEISVQCCLTGHVLSILANWKVVFATHWKHCTKCNCVACTLSHSKCVCSLHQAQISYPKMWHRNSSLNLLVIRDSYKPVPEIRLINFNDV